MECAYRIIEGKSEEARDYGHPKMVKFFIDNIHEEIKKNIKETESLSEQLICEETFISDVCVIRNNYAHTKSNIFYEDSLNKQEKMHIMSKCLIYQMLKEIFKLPYEKEIIDYLNSIRFRRSYPI